MRQNVALAKTKMGGTRLQFYCAAGDDDDDVLTLAQLPEIWPVITTKCSRKHPDKKKQAAVHRRDNKVRTQH